MYKMYFIIIFPHFFHTFEQHMFRKNSVSIANPRLKRQSTSSKEKLRSGETRATTPATGLQFTTIRANENSLVHSVKGRRRIKNYFNESLALNFFFFFLYFHLHCSFYSIFILRPYIFREIVFGSYFILMKWFSIVRTKLRRI